ncbi:hypothetical protein MHU86_24481 [Fragilaria crotonensis]|nr:hypothetical protein MHU86_24481 [Fragilaria crotonensis]
MSTSDSKALPTVTTGSAQMRFPIRAAALTLLTLILMAYYQTLDTTYDALVRESKPVNETSSELTTVPLTPAAESAHEEKNLVAFVALGTQSSIPTVHHNVHSHFMGWDCVVFVHKNESEISPDDIMMKEIGTKCSIVRLPGLYWSHFLITLTPEMAQQYKYIAVVLDDLFAPTHGDTPVNTVKLLQQMEQYNLSSISPTIKGSVWPATLPQERCLWHAHQIETFFQIFSRDLFNCWRSFMHFSNYQGWCLDLCLDQQLCPSISRLGVDATMIAYHMGNSGPVRDFVPESALVGVNLPDVMDRPVTSGDLALCEQRNCSLYVPSSTKLHCD